MLPTQSVPDPAASPSSIGRFGCGLRGLCGSPTSTTKLHQDGGSSVPSSPQRSAILEPVLLGSPESEVGINYFTYGSTKDTMIRSPELHRHVLSTSVDAESVRQVAQACTVSKNLQGPVDLAAAGTPMASGSTVPNRSPYLQPLPNRTRGPRPGDPPVPQLGLPAPLRPLTSLLEGGVVGSPGAAVRRARRHGGGGRGDGSRGGSATSLAAHPAYEPSQATVTSNSRGSAGTISGGLERCNPVQNTNSRISLFSSVYGQPSAASGGGGGGVAAAGAAADGMIADGGAASSSDEGGVKRVGEELRYYALSQYVPPLHLPPPPGANTAAAGGVTESSMEGGGVAAAAAAWVQDRGSGVWVDGLGCDVGLAIGDATSPAAAGPAGAATSGGAQADDAAALQDHIEHLRSLHHLRDHDNDRNQQQSLPLPFVNVPQPQSVQPPTQPGYGGGGESVGGPQQQQEQQQMRQQSQQASDLRAQLPVLDLRAVHSHRGYIASSVTVPLTHNPVAAARSNGRLRERSLTERAADWRRSFAADGGRGGGGGAFRRILSTQQRKPLGAQLSGTLADWVKNSQSVYSLPPNSHVRAQAGGLWSDRRRQQRNGGDNGGGGGSGGSTGRSAAGGGGGGGGGDRQSSGEEDLAALWGRPRRRRGPIRVDPELVRQYTERPPKLCTPNNASRPVTSSDFVAFKNHTVNRTGTANTLRTVLGSNSPAGGGGGGAGGSGAVVAAEARGVMQLTTLLGPAWVQPALRSRTPHIGVGGILTGSSNSVPGLHVPLELDPPPRPPPPPSGTAAGGATSPSALFRRSLEFSDGVSSQGSPGAAAAAAAAAAAGDRTGTPLTASTFGAASSLPAPVPALTASRAGPAPHMRCGAGELTLDVHTWLTPPTAPAGELCGLFNGDDGESVALLSRVVKGAVQCDLGWAEVSESLMFMSTVTVPNAVMRFPVPHRAILQRFAATIGGTTLIAEAVARSGGGNGFELEEDEEDDDPGPGKVFNKGFGRRNHPAGHSGRPPTLRVPLGKIRGDIFITISYIVQLESAGNTLSLTHVCNWTPARLGWHLVSRDPMMSGDGSWFNNAPNNRRSKHKASDLYDLSFELEVLSHRGLNLVSGPRHMTIKPNYDALLIQGYTQVWRPRHMTTVTFELALAVPLRSFAILHDARRSGPETHPEPAASSVRRDTNGSNNDGAGGDGAGGGAGGGGGGALTPPQQASTSLRLIVPTGLAHLAPGLDGTKSTITLRSAPPPPGLNLEPRPLSTRHCAAVTFVPGSHFSPAELEEVLGPEVAPGPRAQAAAIRAGLPGAPGPLPVELWVVVDCCGPTGIAAHLMQMLQTLQVLLRSLPAAETGGGGGGGAMGSPVAPGGSGGAFGSGSSVGGSTMNGTGGGGGGAAAAVAAATLFNVVICPAGPLVLDPEDEEAALAMLPPELASLHLATRQQQQQQLLRRQRQLQPHQHHHQHQGLLQPTIGVGAGVGAGVGVDDVPQTSVLHSDANQQQQPQQRSEAPLSQHLLQQQQQQLQLQQHEDVMALPPLWLFPGGSRPVNAENVAAALSWVEQLLADSATLAAWAQPVSALHDLLADVAWSPRPSSCRRAAILLCQQVTQSSDAAATATAAATTTANGDGSGHMGASHSRSNISCSGARSPSLRRTGSSFGGRVSRLTSKHLNAVNQAGKMSTSGCSRGASARLRLRLDSEPDSRQNSRPVSRANSRPPSRSLSRSASRPVSRTGSPSRSLSPTNPASRPGSPRGSCSPSGLRRGLSFGELPPLGYAKAAAAAVAAAAAAGPSPSPQAPQVQGGHHDGGSGGGGAAAAAGSDSGPSGNPELGGVGGGGGGRGGGEDIGEVINIVHGNGAVQSPTVGRFARGASPEPYRPRSSLARGGQGRTGGNAADGVRWSNGVVSNPRGRRGGGSGNLGTAAGSGGETELSDSDLDAAGRQRATGPSPLRGTGGGGAADGTGTGTSGDDEEELSTGPPAVDPPDVGFVVFVVVHELSSPSSNMLLAAGLGAAAAFNSNSPSYLLAYHLYQKHIEALLYRQARDEVEQLPLSYFERLADLHGGFMQVVRSPLELSSALVLATSCAVNGRYLRQLRVVARGSVIREQFPAKLPPALPLSEPLSLLVRLSRMQPGAVLELQGTWPNGRLAHMELSVDPRLRTTGQLLPLLCALSEISTLLKDVPFAVPRVSAVGGNNANNASGVGGGGSAGGVGGVGGVTRISSQTLSSGLPLAAAAAAATASAAGASSIASASAATSTAAATAAAPGWPPLRVTPQQQAAKRRVTNKALAFNLVTPFTAMALVSMTLISNRGLTVQTLQTTQGRTPDQRHAFVWPGPVMAALTSAARDAVQQNNGAASPYHTASTFSAAATSTAGTVQGPGGQPGQGPPALASQLDLPAELIAFMSGSVSTSLDPTSNGGGGAIGGAAPATTATAAAATAAAMPAVASTSAPSGSAVATTSCAPAASGSTVDDDDDALVTPPPPLPPQPTLVPHDIAAVTASIGVAAAANPEASDLEQSQVPELIPTAISGADTDVDGGAANGDLMLVRARRRSAAMQELSSAIAGSALAARRASALGLVPVAVVSPDVANIISYRLSGSGAVSPPYPTSRRQSLVDSHDPSTASGAAGSGGSASGGVIASTVAAAQLKSTTPQPGSAAAAVMAAVHMAQSPSSPSTTQNPAATGTGGLSAVQSQSTAPFPSPKLTMGPYTPPISASVSGEAHQLTVLGRLAVMQAADGSWPAVPELEELVVSNGRNLVIPIFGSPKSSTQAEKNAAEVRETRRREALAALRDQTLRGAVSGACWSTVLALALLGAKYGAQRLIWVPLETKAYAWLDRKWPPMSSCGLSAPAAIMRVSALL